MAPSEDDLKKSEELKLKANELFKEKSYVPAIKLYTEAIKLNPTNPALYTNRAFCNLRIENFGLAIEDSQAALKIDPKFSKAFYREGSAYLLLGKLKESLKAFTQAARLSPKDADIRSKMEFVKKEIKRKAFEEAIQVGDEPSIVESLCVDDMVVPPDYETPHIPEEGITLDFVLAMMEHFKNQKNLHPKYLYKILIAAKDVLSKEETLVDISFEDHITVCGDTHGQFYDLLNIFALNGNPSASNPYLFNGDFVDRGSFSCEVVITLMAFKILYPKHMFLHRGNHETKGLNKIYGFEGEVKAKYGESAYKLFCELFCSLPLCSVLNKKVFVCHGGLFNKEGVKLQDIKAVNRFSEPPESGIFVDLIWSDPMPNPGRALSKRGTGVSFGPDVTAQFLGDNGLDLIVRSHEVKDAGYAIEHDGKCITVFSAPNYCDQVGNKGAFVKFDAATLKPVFTQYDAVPHPKVPPMAYSAMSSMAGMSSLFM